MTERVMITNDELLKFQAQVAELPGAIAVFETLAECEGDLEDAAISVALQVGQEPDHSDGWLNDTAKSWRHVLCQPEVRSHLAKGEIKLPVETLIEQSTLPARLAMLVAVHAAKLDLPSFCQAFEKSE